MAHLLALTWVLLVRAAVLSVLGGLLLVIADGALNALLTRLVLLSVLIRLRAHAGMTVLGMTVAVLQSRASQTARRGGCA